MPLVFKIFISILSVCMNACIYVGHDVSGAYEGQKRVMDPLELCGSELPCGFWDQILGSLASILKHWTISPAPKVLGLRDPVKKLS